MTRQQCKAAWCTCSASLWVCNTMHAQPSPFMTEDMTEVMDFVGLVVTRKCQLMRGKDAHEG